MAGDPPASDEVSDMATTNPNAPVITALGLITPYGLGLEAFLAGRASGEALPAGARCPELDVKEYLPAEKTYLDRCSELSLVAAALALGSAGFQACESGAGETQAWKPALPERFGIALGTAYGCLDSMYANTSRVQTKGARLASPLLFMHSFVNAPASLIAIEWGLQGPGATFTDGGLSAASALYWACDLLRRGEVDAMLVGGADGGRWMVEGGSGIAGTGEAAAIFLLERAEVAERRGARVLAEVAEALPPTASGNLCPTGKSPTESPLPLGRGPGGRAGADALGAHFALLLAAALGELSGQGPVTVEYAEGNRAARAVLSKPRKP